MAFDLKEVFANLAEKEKIKGHHSPEGAAIRILSRALTGWLAGNLRVLDVLVLCEQGMEDWLKRRLALRSWSSLGLSELLSQAIDKELVTRLDAVRLQKLHLTRIRLDEEGGGDNPRDVESALELCLQIVEKHW
jgi:hypothetical protein